MHCHLIVSQCVIFLFQIIPFCIVFYVLLSEHCNAVFGLPCLNKGNDVDDNDDLDLENEQVSSLRDSSGSPPKSIPSSQFSSLHNESESSHRAHSPTWKQ